MNVYLWWWFLRLCADAMATKCVHSLHFSSSVTRKTYTMVCMFFYTKWWCFLYVYVHIFIYTYVHTYIHISLTLLYVSMHVFMRICWHRMYVFAHWSYMMMRVDMNACIYIYTYIYTYESIYRNKQTLWYIMHIYIYIFSQFRKGRKDDKH